MTPRGDPASVVRGSAVWIPPGTPPLSVGGYAITGGMFYVGAGLPAAYAASYEPALIDPAAPVHPGPGDPAVPPQAREAARPDYARFAPPARAGYLAWLAAGRTGSCADAYPWLFFFGLERRVLVDLVGSAEPLAEFAAIRAEVARLRDRYAAVPDFARQADELLELLGGLVGLADPALSPPGAADGPPADGPAADRPDPSGAGGAGAPGRGSPAPTRPGGALPAALRVGLGRFLGGGGPLPATWAYAWLREHLGPRPAGFRRAFAARYAAAYPDGGLRVPPQAAELVLAYRPASPGFAGRSVDVHTRLPDVEGLTAPLTELLAVARRAEVDLASASGAPGPRAAPAAGSRESSPPPEPAGPDPTAGRPAGGAAPRPAVLAAAILLRFAIVAGLSGEDVRTVRRQAVDALELDPAERHRLDDAVRSFTARRPDPSTVRLRFLRLDAAQQRGVTDLLVAAAGGNGTLEPSDVDLLARVFAVLGAADDDLHRRVAEVEVASVTIDGASIIALDTDAVARILAAGPRLLPLLEALLAPWAGGPPPGYAAAPANLWTAAAAGTTGESGSGEAAQR